MVRFVVVPVVSVSHPIFQSGWDNCQHRRRKSCTMPSDMTKIRMWNTPLGYVKERDISCWHLGHFWTFCKIMLENLLCFSTDWQAAENINMESCWLKWNLAISHVANGCWELLNTSYIGNTLDIVSPSPPKNKENKEKWEKKENKKPHHLGP